MGKPRAQEYDGRMAKYSRAKRIEKQEVGILETLLNAHPLLTQLTKGDDDFPLIDGYIHLLKEQDEVDYSRDA